MPDLPVLHSALLETRPANAWSAFLGRVSLPCSGGLGAPERREARLSALWWALIAFAPAACAPDERPPPATSCAEEPRQATGPFFAAGSGAAIPLARAAAAGLIADHPEATRRWHVAASIGSRGAIAALEDGAIDVGLLGRAPTDDEQARWQVRVVAETAVVFATTTEGRPPAMRLDELVALYRGERARWPDGSPVRLLVRERGDSAEAAIAARAPALAAAMAAARDEGRAAVAWTDDQLRDALASTPGALAPIDLLQLGLDRLPAQVATLDGQTPTPDAVRAGRFRRALGVLWRRDASAATEAAATSLADAMAALARERGADVPR
jgi:phosphate transport system substrate-binding protein